MPFEDVMPAPPSARERKKPVLATMTMPERPGSKNGAYALLSIGTEIGKQLRWRADAPCILQLGSGADAGKFRVAMRDKAPLKIRQMRHVGAWSVSLGHVSVFGNKRRPKVPVEIRLVDPLTVEVHMPEWPEAQADKALARVDRAVEMVRMTAAAPKPVAIRQPTTPPPVNRDPPQRISGAVAVRSKDGTVSITVKPLMIRCGREPGIELSVRQAYLLACLVPATDLGFIPTDHLVEKTGYRAEEIRWLVIELERPLRSIGLRLGEMPKMGYSLVKEKADAAPAD